MLTQIRHIQKGTLIVVTILIVIAFAFLYSDYDFVQGTVGRQDCVVKVYERCYRQKEARKLAAHYDVAFRLGMYDFASVLFGEERRDQDRTDFILSLVILRTEAEKLGIEPTEEEIKEAIPNLPVFQQPWVDATFVENNILGPSGFTDGDMAQLVKDYLSFQKMRSLLGVGVSGLPSEVERIYTRQNQRYTGSLVAFDRADYEGSIEVTEAEIEEYFEQNTVDLLSEPKRGFDYVKFEPKKLPEDATNEQRAKATLAFANAVNRAYADLAAEDSDFMEIARIYEGREGEFDLEAGTFEPFAGSEPPEALAGDGALIETLFREALQPDEVTVPIPTGESEDEEGGYYVFHFSTLLEPRPLTLEEATPAIRETLLARKADRAVRDAANEARAALNEALAAGKTFSEAAEGAGVEPVELANFSEAEPPADVPDPGLIASAVRELGENEVSSVMERPGDRGFFLVHVERIELYEDEDREAEERSIMASTELGVKRSLFTAWFNQRRAESGSERPTFRQTEELQ